MAKNTKRKYAAIALGIVGIAGLSLASAAQLDVNQNSPLVGVSAVDNGCDTDGVNVSYTTAFNGTNFTVSAVNVSNINALCVGKTITVYVQDKTAPTPVTLGTAAGTLTSATSVTLTPTPLTIDAKDVYAAAVSIN